MDQRGTALYLRLSREDGERQMESQSIANQRAYLLRYAQEHDFIVTGIFVDDGGSGTSFERPAFQQMVQEIEAGRVGTVITKDLSRLGRDYIQTGHFLERYFPEHGVRYIAVNDRIDTGEQEGNDLAPFLSVVNDMYARDISKKVRAALSVRKETGQFIGSVPPFGYQKDPEQRGRLRIDPQAAPVVRMIYRAYLRTGQISQVVRALNARQIPPPSGRKKDSSVGWNDVTVRRILSNPTYAGHLTQNRTRKISHKVGKKVCLPPEEWVTVPNTHAPIVPQELFDQVQAILKMHGRSRKERSQQLPQGQPVEVQFHSCTPLPPTIFEATGGGSRSCGGTSEKDHLGAFSTRKNSADFRRGDHPVDD